MGHRQRHVELETRQDRAGGQLLHRQHRLEEVAALPAVLFRNFDCHQAEPEHLIQQILAEQAGLVHLADVRGDLVAGELPHGGLKHAFLFVETGERAHEPPAGSAYSLQFLS